MLTDADWIVITNAAVGPMGLHRDNPRKWRASGYLPAINVADLAKHTGIPLKKLMSAVRPRKAA